MNHARIAYTVLIGLLGMAGCGGAVQGTTTAGKPSATASRPRGTDSQPSGVDVSHWEGAVDWGAVANSGQAFAYIKATEGTSYRSPTFGAQYDGSFNAGLIRGSYHFARPDVSNGAAQADYFVDHGGGWSADGQTLPGALDIEYNPYGDTCYGLSTGDMVSWVNDFFNEYNARTGVNAVIYSTADWWNTCTGGATDFGGTNPLWVANYDTESPALPAGWSTYTFWQYTDSGSVPGIGSCDVSLFNGASSDLQALALNQQ